MKRRQLIPTKLSELFDTVRRRIAYVPAVSDTISSMKDLGIDLKEDKKDQKLNSSIDLKEQAPGVPWGTNSHNHHALFDREGVQSSEIPKPDTAVEPPPSP